MLSAVELRVLTERCCLSATPKVPTRYASAALESYLLQTEHQQGLNRPPLDTGSARARVCWGHEVTGPPCVRTWSCSMGAFRVLVAVSFHPYIARDSTHLGSVLSEQSPHRARLDAANQSGDYISSAICLLSSICIIGPERGFQPSLRLSPPSSPAVRTYPCRPSCCDCHLAERARVHLVVQKIIQAVSKQPRGKEKLCSFRALRGDRTASHLVAQCFEELSVARKSVRSILDEHAESPHPQSHFSVLFDDVEVGEVRRASHLTYLADDSIDSL